MYIVAGAKDWSVCVCARYDKGLSELLMARANRPPNGFEMLIYPCQRGPVGLTRVEGQRRVKGRLPPLPPLPALALVTHW